MKLNIGCGKQYKEGFINIDVFDTTVADKIMPAHNLAFPSNSIDEIQAMQLIEHLGYINARYALAEWFRVLKPGGTLWIETPDIETAFRKYLNGTHSTKKELLSWIYGLDSQGMSHQLCFPDVLLEDLLRKAGFVVLKKSFLEQEENNPTLRICCKKPQQYEINQIISCCRKTVMKRKLVIRKPDLIAVEQDLLFDFFLTYLRRYNKKKNISIIDELVIEGGIKSPIMTLILVEECINQHYIPKQMVQKHLRVLEFLISIKNPSLLVSLIKEAPSIPGTQTTTVETVITLVKHSVRKMLSDGKTGRAVKTSLVNLSRRNTLMDQVFFSEKVVEYEATQLVYQGMKDFIRGEFELAIMKLQEAIHLDRNHVLYYWNLGRLFALTKKFSQAKKWYDAAIVLMKKSRNPTTIKLVKVLEKEKNMLPQRNWDGPVIEVNI